MTSVSGHTDALERLATSRFAILAVLLFVLLAVAPGMGSIPVLDRDEARFAQATRQMLETGDFVRIFVQDEPRNKKPIGIHWLQSATASLTTQSEIWGYRLASLIGLMCAALGAFWAGAALLGRTTAFAGASLFAVGLLASTEGMIAKTDAALCGATALAMAALARLYIGQGGRWSALGVWAAIGVGVLIKGPVAAMVVGLAIVTLGVWERRWTWAKPLAHWSGPLAFAIIVAPWMAAIGLATNGAFFAEAIGGDLGPKVAGGHEGHFGWPGYHLVLAPLLLFPASALLIPAVRGAWTAARAPRDSAQNAPMRFLIAWLVPTWLVFELLPTKLPHYTLPAFPAVALLCGAALVTFAHAPWRKRLASTALLALAGAGLIALAAVISTYMPGDAEADARRAIQAALVGGVGVIALAFAILAVRTPTAILAVLVCAGVLSAYGLRERLLPETRDLLVSDQTERALSRQIPDWRFAQNGRVLVVGYRETSLVFETRTDVRLLNGEQAAAVASPGDIALVNRAAEASTGLDAGLAARGLRFEPSGPAVAGLNYSNGDETLIQPGRIVSAP